MYHAQIIQTKLDGVFSQIYTLQRINFPYKSSKIALEHLEKICKDNQLRLASLPNGPSAVELCSQLSAELSIITAILGFVANSSQTRNPFEIYEPLWRLASTLLYPDQIPSLANVNLIISSEWNYNPCVMPSLFFSLMKDFVLIALPATESTNPLILPLAGHELGHIIWLKNNISALINQKINQEILNVAPSRQPALLDQDYTELSRFAMRQSEELFCDILGLRIFRTAYIQAFFYILAPSTRHHSTLLYPHTRHRIATLKVAAKKFNIDYPLDEKAENLLPDRVSSHLAAKYSQINSIVQAILPILLEKVEEIVHKAKITQSSSAMDAEEVRIQNCFKIEVPATNIMSIADILNAGWKMYLSNQHEPHMPNQRVMDLILKTFEMFAIEQRLIER